VRFPALLLLLATLSAQPARTVWIRAVNGTGPDVHSVETSSGAVTVRSGGISLAWLGPLGTPPRPGPPREFTFHIPLSPKPENTRHAHIPADYAGAFVNGVPIYNQFETTSYRGQNLWHFDPIAQNAKSTHAAPRPGLLEALAQGNGRRAPIIGFALDGYPVYGAAHMRSSYQLRRISTRDRWPDGTSLAPGQSGPPVNAEFPLGTFAEDYEYVAGSGDLDEYNGKTVKTAEYPDGTYAYFLSANTTGQLAFPYLFANEFYGQYTAAHTPGALQFRVPDGKGGLIRQLEFVHEKPMHVLVISHDRHSFAHIHPEVNEDGVWEVLFPFPHGGKFRVYADYTPPGGNQRIEHYDIPVPGPAATPGQSPNTVHFENTAQIHAGEDVELQFHVDESVRGWQPYLGAWAHVVIAGEQLSSLLHAHPLDQSQTSEMHGHTLAPPPDNIRVATNFAAPGSYKLWFQLQINNVVQTIPFDLRVHPGTPRKPNQIPNGATQIKIGEHGYEPARLQVPAGEPVTLAITRTSEGNCGSRIVFPALHIEKEIPPGGMAVLTLPALPPGEIRFSCGMGMYRGAVVAVSAIP
jgi:hypothetical protein